jgi:hypothetical protein
MEISSEWKSDLQKYSWKDLLDTRRKMRMTTFLFFESRPTRKRSEFSGRAHSCSSRDFISDRESKNWLWTFRRPSATFVQGSVKGDWQTAFSDLREIAVGGRFRGHKMHFSSWTCGFGPIKMRTKKVRFPLMRISIIMSRGCKFRTIQRLVANRWIWARQKLHVQHFTFYCVIVFSPWSSYSTYEFQRFSRSGVADFALNSA